jgi:hypothetical protein
LKKQKTRVFPAVPCAYGDFFSGDLSGFNAHTDCGIARGAVVVASASLLGISSCITASSFPLQGRGRKKVLQRMGVGKLQRLVAG